MHSGIVKYLIDANSIRALSRDLINCKRNNNRIIATIDDVKHEVATLSKVDLYIIQSLSPDAYLKMGELLNNYESVRKLVNYYENKGSADVALLAHALTVEGGTLYQDEVVIVTDDVALQLAATELGAGWISSGAFKQL